MKFLVIDNITKIFDIPPDIFKSVICKNLKSETIYRSHALKIKNQSTRTRSPNQSTKKLYL